jgi:nucleotide-binding universal stress UspA family protein
MLLPGIAGATLLPYATLWLSRSARLRRAAIRIAASRWHARGALAACALSLYVIGASGSALLPVPPLAPAATAAALGVSAYAHVETFVAAEAMRTYPDEQALHFDLERPRTWLATARLIYAAWTYLLATRHRPLAPAFLGSAALWVGGARLLPADVALALAADAAVLGLCCVYGPSVDREAVAAKLR